MRKSQKKNHYHSDQYNGLAHHNDPVVGGVSLSIKNAVDRFSDGAASATEWMRRATHRIHSLALECVRTLRPLKLMASLQNAPSYQRIVFGRSVAFWPKNTQLSDFNERQWRRFCLVSILCQR